MSLSTRCKSMGSMKRALILKTAIQNELTRRPYCSAAHRREAQYRTAASRYWVQSLAMAACASRSPSSVKIVAEGVRLPQMEVYIDRPCSSPSV